MGEALHIGFSNLCNTIIYSFFCTGLSIFWLLLFLDLTILMASTGLCGNVLISHYDVLLVQLELYYFCLLRN